MMDNDNSRVAFRAGTRILILVIVIIFQNYNVVKLVFRKLINGSLVMI